MGTKFANSRGWGEDVTGRGGGGGVDKERKRESRTRKKTNVQCVHAEQHGVKLP